MTIDFQPAITFEVNPDAFGFDPATAVPGTTYELEPIEIELLGYEARIVQADYMVQGISRGFDFGIKADPALQSIPFILTSPVIGGMGAGGGGSSFNESKGLVSSIVLRDGSMQYPLQIQVNSVNIKGNWSTVWDAPAEPDQTLKVFNECFSLSDWKHMLENPPVLPTEISGKILFKRAAFAPDPSEFIANLDGSQERSLVFGHSSLSPDGSQLVYSNLKGQIVILNLENNTETILYDKTDAFQPIWSPDGKSIAFTEFNETTQILVMDTDGSNLREIIKSNLYPDLLGWTADNKHLMYRNQLGERRGPLILLDIDSKEEIELFDILSRASMSPNGQWIAYIDSVPGKTGSGLYVSKPDQSEKRLLVQLDYLAISNVTWSPDGKWLGFSVFDNSTFIPTSAVGIINLESCQVYPIQIPGIEILREWRNP
jgi:WD40 repeat protein